ncbi:MAG: EF-hand domain-containing protein [Hyphomicrobiaceae bacterium]
MKKRTIVVLAGATLAVGAVGAAIAQGHHRGHHMGPRMGKGHMGSHMGGPMGGRMGAMEGGLRRLCADAGPRMQWRRAMREGGIAWTQIEERRNGCFAKLDKNSDGVVDKAEVEAVVQAQLKERIEWRFKVMVHRFDTDKDGKITKEEFERFAKMRFAMRDLDGDGKITDADRPPFAHGRGRRGSGTDAAEPKAGEGRGPGRGAGRGQRGRDVSWTDLAARRAQLFARFDRNGDGVIDASEIAAAKTASMDYVVKRIMHRFDQNKDGKITKDEFHRFAKERFALADLNGDGKITAEDLPPFGRGFGRGR